MCDERCALAAYSNERCALAAYGLMLLTELEHCALAAYSLTSHWSGTRDNPPITGYILILSLTGL